MDHHIKAKHHRCKVARMEVLQSIIALETGQGDVYPTTRDFLEKDRRENHCDEPVQERT